MSSGSEPLSAQTSSYDYRSSSRDTRRSSLRGSSRATNSASKYRLTDSSIWDEGGLGVYGLGGQETESDANTERLPSRVRGLNRKRNALENKYDEQIQRQGRRLGPQVPFVEYDDILDAPLIGQGPFDQEDTLAIIENKELNKKRRIEKVDRTLKRLTDRALAPARRRVLGDKLTSAVQEHLYNPDKSDYYKRYLRERYPANPPGALNSVLQAVTQARHPVAKPAPKKQKRNDDATRSTATSKRPRKE